MLFEESNFDDGYEETIDGIIFLGDTANEETDRRARRIAAAYNEKYDELIDFMIEKGIGILYFGGITHKELKEALSCPTVDLDADILSIIDEKLDDTTIMEIGYSGDLDKFEYLYIKR